MPSATVRLRARGHVLDLAPGDPAIMGVVNANPGSFSDRRHLASTAEQVCHGLGLVGCGATVVDVGTDSGVTYDASRPLDEQVARVVPLVHGLVAGGALVSVDTPSVEVARAAVAAGAAIVNDVSGLADPAMAALCAEQGAGLVVMHTRAGHKQQAYLRYDDVVDDVLEVLAERLEAARTLGVAEEQLLVDPGIGYAKLPEDDARLLAAYDRLAELGRPVLTGASRKYLGGVITGAAPPERLPETLATVQAVRRVPGLVRVHDVEEVARFLAVAAVIDGVRPFPAYDLDDDRLKWVRAGRTG